LGKYRPGDEIPRTLNQRGIKAVLEAHDWVETIGGNHVVKMEKVGQRPITLPKHKNGGLRPAIAGQDLARGRFDPGGSKWGVT